MLGDGPGNRQHRNNMPDHYLQLLIRMTTLGYMMDLLLNAMIRTPRASYEVGLALDV